MSYQPIQHGALPHLNPRSIAAARRLRSRGGGRDMLPTRRHAVRQDPARRRRLGALRPVRGRRELVLQRQGLLPGQRPLPRRRRQQLLLHPGLHQRRVGGAVRHGRGVQEQYS